MSFKIAGFNLLEMQGVNNKDAYNATSLRKSPIDPDINEKLTNGSILTWDQDNQNWSTGNPVVYPLFASFISTTTQPTVRNTLNPNSIPITLDSRVIGTIDVSGSTFPNSEIIIPSKGVYRILFSAQCDCTSGTHYIEIFPVVNGISVPNSNTRIRLNAGIESCLTVEYFLTFNTNDILQFVMTGDNTANAFNARLLYVSSVPGNPVDIPAIPSIIVTIQQISF